MNKPTLYLLLFLILTMFTACSNVSPEPTPTIAPAKPLGESPPVEEPVLSDVEALISTTEPLPTETAVPTMIPLSTTTTVPLATVTSSLPTNTPIPPSTPRGSPPATAMNPTAARCAWGRRRGGGRNYSQCDSLLLGDKCGAHTFPYLEVKNSTATVEHEATTSKIGEDQLFYCRQRGISEEDAISMIVNGFCKEVLRELPMEFAVEAQKLLGVSLEGSVG